MSPSKKVLLVFVPGIMASRLELPRFPDVYWDPDSNSRMIKWVTASVPTEMAWIDHENPATVLSQNTNTRLSAVEIARGWGGIYWGGYGNFLRLIATTQFKADCPVYCFGYDWRQSNYENANQLFKMVEQAWENEKPEKVIFITHSMGGIVARSTLLRFPILADKALCVIHVAQPVSGSVAFYRRFFTGAISSIDGGRFFARVLGNTSAKFTAIVSGIPGAFELLPSNHYKTNWMGEITNSGVNYWKGDVYKLYRNVQIPPGLPDSSFGPNIKQRVLKQAADADVFHSWLKLFKHSNTYSVVGNGIPTDTEVFFDTQNQNSPNWVQPSRPADGDETVPSLSAAALFPLVRNLPPFNPKIEQYELRGVKHADAFNNMHVQQLVTAMIDHYT
jgi:pimeloyl-ACP methyl ester carboxylesterase